MLTPPRFFLYTDGIVFAKAPIRLTGGSYRPYRIKRLVLDVGYLDMPRRLDGIALLSRLELSGVVPNYASIDVACYLCPVLCLSSFELCIVYYMTVPLGVHDTLLTIV